MENWKPVLGYEGFYAVSDGGNVRSEPRTVVHKAEGSSKRLKGKILVPYKTGTGYFMVSLAKHGLIRKRLVHALVLEAFHGKAPQKFEGCHGNGNRLDNALANLRWDTRKNNHADKILHGTTNRGNRNGSSKLTEDQVRAIIFDDRKQYEIAKDYGIRQSHVSRLKNSTRWGHLEK